jgi:hypothetical protein
MIKERFRVKQKIEIWMEIIEGSGSFYLKLIMWQAPAASTKVFGPAWGSAAASRNKFIPGFGNAPRSFC